MTIFYTGPNSKQLQTTNVAKIMISIFYRVENSVGKGENAGYQHLLFFSTQFSKGFFHGVDKSRDCVVKIRIGKLDWCALKTFRRPHIGT